MKGLVLFLVNCLQWRVSAGGLAFRILILCLALESFDSSFRFGGKMTIEWVFRILSFRRGKLIACVDFWVGIFPFGCALASFTQDVSIKDLTFSFSSWSRSSSFHVFWGKWQFCGKVICLCQPHLHPNRLALKIWGLFWVGEFGFGYFWWWT